jgi:protein TonB
MEASEILKASYEDLIFENRNKAYGAYALRTTYNKRIRNGLLIALAIISALILYPTIMRMLEESVAYEAVEKNTTVNEMVAPPPLDETTPPPPEVKIPQIETIKFVPPKIVEKVTKEEEIKSVEEIKQAANIGSQDIEGTKEIITEPVKEIIKEIEVKEEEPLTIVENSAEFPGGQKALAEYVVKNLRYPQQAQDFNIQGTVYVIFTVEKDGRLTNVAIRKDIGGGCGAEAVRVVSGMPAWSAGEQGGNKVRQRITIPIKFQLK